MKKSKWGVLPEGKFATVIDMKRVTTSLDMSKPAERAYLDALNADRRSNIDDFLDRKIVLRHVIHIAGKGDFENSTNYSDRPYLGLITNTGEMIKTGSTGLMMNVSQLIEAHGEPPWDDAFSVTVEYVKLGGKKKTYNLKIVGPNGQIRAGKKGGKKAKKAEDVPF